MKISVGLPVYDGKVMMQQTAALLNETSLAWAQGDLLTVRFLPSCTNLALGRNQLVKEFLASGDDKLVFLDADVTFEPGALLRLAHYSAEFVGGAYRFKKDTESYPIHLLDRPAGPGPGGLVEVAMVPTGFLALSPSVFHRFREMYPGREYGIEGHRSYCYFQIPYADGSIFTEDAYFCKEWREKGGRIYLDPDLNLTHWQGNIPYPGNIGKWFQAKQRAKGAVA